MKRWTAYVANAFLHGHERPFQCTAGSFGRRHSMAFGIDIPWVGEGMNGLTVHT